MKKVLLSSLLAMMMIMFASMNIHAEDSKTVSYKSSMHCNACKSTIMKSLKAENGVEDVEADVETNIVTVKYNPAKTNEDKIASNIKKAGYKADKTEAKAEGCSEKKSGCCGSGGKTEGKNSCSSKTKKTAA